MVALLLFYFRMNKIFGFPGDRCKVFDPRLFVDDKKTPLSKTMQPATVLKRYSYFSNGFWDDVVDVIFDHNNRVSRAHFTNGVIPL